MGAHADVRGVRVARVRRSERGGVFEGVVLPHALKFGADAEVPDEEVDDGVRLGAAERRRAGDGDPAPAAGATSRRGAAGRKAGAGAPGEGATGTGGGGGGLNGGKTYGRSSHVSPPPGKLKPLYSS